MAVSREGVEKMKSELHKHERKLLKHENKWNAASVVQRLSSHDQSRLLKASVAARTLTVTLIPKLKEKIDTWQTKKEDRLLQEIFTDYEIVDKKVRLAFEEFNKLESGNDKTKRAFRNDRDKALSLSIEQSLKQRKESKAGLSGVSLSAGSGQTSRCGVTSLGAGSKTQPVIAGSCESVKEQLKGGGDVNETLVDEIKGLWSTDEETRKFLEQLEKTLTPEELNWLLYSKQAMKLIREADPAEKTNHKDSKILKKGVEDKVTKWIDDEHHEKASECAKGGTKEKSLSLKAAAPTPIPIDTFINFVESLPGEIRNMVREQTESLYAIGKDQIFTGKQLSDPKGRMVSMDKLREEYRDDRFDASDYRIRVPDDLIDETYLKWMKEQKVDDAVERYFGSFKKRELPPLTGDLLDIIEVPGFMERLPKTEPPQPPDEDPEELLEKYHIQRINLLKEPDFDFSEDVEKI